MDQTQNITRGPRKTAQKQERRAAERHPFCESAEVVAVGQGNRLVGRVADISMEGCYVDTFNPFPVETESFTRLIFDAFVGENLRSVTPHDQDRARANLVPVGSNG